MKKLLLLLMVSAGLNAQILLQENFDALGSPVTLPTGWTMTNQSSPIGTSSWFAGNPASFTSYNGPDDGYIAVNFQSGSGTSTLSNWLLTPPVTVQNGDEVSFYTRVPSGSSWADRLELRQSVLGAGSTDPVGFADVGSYSTVCLTVNPNLVASEYPATWTKYTYVVTGLTGQVSCRFALRYTVPNGGPNGTNSNYVGVDAFNVKRLVANDLSLNSVTVPAIIPAGNFTFNGQVENQGTNPVTSYQVTWQANSGAVNTYDVTGVNIAVGATHNFTHSVALSAVAGQAYALNFNVSTVNSGSDGNPVNNTLSKNTQVSSGSTTHKPMIEKFTSSTCGPCASYNNSTFNPFYTATYASDTYNYVAYQMNWPGTGDPYYFAEAGTRRGYYGVNAITSLWINGSEYSTSNNQTTLTAHVNSEASKPAYFGLTASRDFTGNNAAVNYTVTPYLSGNYVMHTAVIEKVTTNNVASNGETSFKHVMMKMVPDANGTTLNCVAGTPITGQISASLSGTFIEQMTDLEVVVFIQNPTTKEVMQSFRATDALSLDTNSIKAVKLYPNPAADLIRLSNIEVVNVQVTDLTGKTLMSLTNVNDQTDINVSNLNSGVYFVTVKGENVNETIKFIKK